MSTPIHISRRRAAAAIWLVVALTAVLTACGTLLGTGVKKAVHMGKDECLKLDLENASTELKALCLTAEELSPFLDLVLARRRQAALQDAGGDAPAQQDAGSDARGD